MVLFAFSPIALWGQMATVKGFIYNDETGEAIPFARVGMEGAPYGTSADHNGFFILNKIPAGTYTLKVSSLGLETHTEEVILDAKKPLDKKIYLKRGSIQLKGVEIEGNRVDRKTETNVSVEKITVKQIKQVPSIGGQADLAQYLQVLPGVTFTGDQGGQLYIRGGSMIQNKTLLDGMVIYNPFHSIGLFSVFESDIMANADVYTGGFGAEYGGRVSSIMDITTRDGNRRRHAGKVGISTFGANALLEGPLKKATPDNESSITYILTAKNSYLSHTSKALYSYATPDNTSLPYDFLDIYGKVSFLGTNGSKFNVYGFNFTDEVKNYQSIADYSWSNYGFGANFVVVPGVSALLEGVLAYSKYQVNMQNNLLNKPSESSIGNFTLGLHMTYFLGKNKVKYGFDIENAQTYYSIYNDNGIRFPKSPSTQNNSEISGFVSYTANFDKFLLEPGLRMIYYGSLSEFSPEPRLALKLNAFEKVRLKFATGLYSQYLLDAKSDRDVVNLFTGFLSGGFMPKQFQGKEVNSALQKAAHFIFGVEIDASEHLLFNIEPYYKRFNRLINLNSNKLYDVIPEYREGGSNPKPEYLMTDFIIETGNAYGIDLSAKYEYDHLYLWLAYSLSYVDRTDEIQTYNPYYDRRHNVNALAAYTLGSSREWEINLRWNFGSGFPFTENQGGYEQIFFGDINTNYLTVNGDLAILYPSEYAESGNGYLAVKKLNGGRLPTYHRMDFMVKRKFSLGRNSILEANVSITNVYNRENMFYFNRVTFDRINQLPFLVSAGLVLTF